jgi:hypothetical protein
MLSIEGAKVKITTRAVWDIETGALLEEDSYEYYGPIELAKGDSTQKGQLNLQNTLQQQQLDKQNALTGQIQSSLAPYLTGNQGFTPQQLAAMNSMAIDTNASQYNSAGNQLRQQLAARGENGQTPLSGTGVAGIAGLLSGKASDLSNALRTNTLNNAQQALANQFNANSILSGTAQTYAGNVGTFGSGASNALNNVTQAQANSGLNKFLGGLGSGLGSGLSAGATGGLGSVLSGIGSGNFGW